MTISKEQAEGIVEILNDLLNRDCEAISELFLHKVNCKHGIAEHPTVICTDGEPFGLRVIGLFNGLMQVDTGQRFCEVYDDSEPNKLAAFGITKTIY